MSTSWKYLEMDNATNTLTIVLSLAFCLQVSQTIEDGLLLYCIACEFKASKTRKRNALCAIIGLTYLVLRGPSLVATVVFWSVVSPRGADWIGPLLLLNAVLWLPSRLVCLQIAAMKAFHGTSSSFAEPDPSERESTVDKQLPTVLVILPCYREHLQMVLSSIRSVARSVYEKDRVHIFLSFDGPQNNQVFHDVIETIGAKRSLDTRHLRAEGRIDNVTITMSVFDHGGKTGCQANTLESIKRCYPKYTEHAQDCCVLLLDSDTLIHPMALRQLGARLQQARSPSTASEGNLVALTCIQGIMRPSSSFLAAFQESEYFLYSIFFEVVMSGFGNVACLAGPFIYLRLESLLRVWDQHVQESRRQDESMYEHWTHSFGEDRCLTQRLGQQFGIGSTDMHTEAVSETEAALTVRSLLLQRRRWFLGAVATEATYLCNINFWRSTPFLSLWRMSKPATVSDVQVVLVLIALLERGLEGYNWLLPTIAGSLLAEMAVLSMFRAIRHRFGFLMYPFGRLLFPFVNATATFWAALSLCERQW